MRSQLPWKVTQAAVPAVLKRTSSGAICAWKVRRGACLFASLHVVSLFVLLRVLMANCWPTVPLKPGNSDGDHAAKHSGYPKFLP